MNSSEPYEKYRDAIAAFRVHSAMHRQTLAHLLPTDDPTSATTWLAELFAGSFGSVAIGISPLDDPRTVLSCGVGIFRLHQMYAETPDWLSIDDAMRKIGELRANYERDVLAGSKAGFSTWCGDRDDPVYRDIVEIRRRLVAALDDFDRISPWRIEGPPDDYLTNSVASISVPAHPILRIGRKPHLERGVAAKSRFLARISKPGVTQLRFRDGAPIAVAIVDSLYGIQTATPEAVTAHATLERDDAISLRDIPYAASGETAAG